VALTTPTTVTVRVRLFGSVTVSRSSTERLPWKPRAARSLTTASFSPDRNPRPATIPSGPNVSGVVAVSRWRATVSFPLETALVATIPRGITARTPSIPRSRSTSWAVNTGWATCSNPSSSVGVAKA